MGSFEAERVEVRFIGDIDSRDLEVGDNDDKEPEDLGDGKRPYKLFFKPCAAIVPDQCSYKVGYYKDTYRKTAAVQKAAAEIAADNQNENSENAGATNNSPGQKGTIGFDNGGNKKEDQGSIDAGSVNLVNQIMYELD